MTTLLFVHGTGVRQESFDATFDMVKGEAAAELPGVRVDSMFWGEKYGARLQHGGCSIPDYTSARAGVIVPTAVEAETARWARLYEDLYLELRLLVAMKPESQPTPGVRQTPGAALFASFKALVAAPPTDALPAGAWQAACTAALETLKNDREFEKLVTGIPAKNPQSEDAVARAVVAAVMLEGAARHLPALDGSRRDAFARVVQDVFLQGRRAGALSTLTDPLKGLATRWVKKRRGRLSDAVLEPPSDILLYLARGAVIRDAIRDAVRGIHGDVVIFAHSLGGIMAVDLLVIEALANVKGLVTVGSQSPLLYEIGALVSLAPTDKLPAHFPKWLNIYDRSDFLSYIAAPTFDKDPRITDFEVTSGQPFPESHSAYFSNRVVWQEVSKFMDRLE